MVRQFKHLSVPEGPIEGMGEPGARSPARARVYQHEQRRLGRTSAGRRARLGAREQGAWQPVGLSQVGEATVALVLGLVGGPGVDLEGAARRGVVEAALSMVVMMMGGKEVEVERESSESTKDLSIDQKKAPEFRH